MSSPVSFSHIIGVAGFCGIPMPSDDPPAPALFARRMEVLGIAVAANAERVLLSDHMPEVFGGGYRGAPARCRCC